MRTSVLTGLLLLASTGCFGAGGGWQQVDVRPGPAIANAREEVRGLLFTHSIGAFTSVTPIQVEATDDYVRMLFVYDGRPITKMLTFRTVAEFRILAREDIFQVSAFNAQGDEIWYWRGPEHDYDSAKRMFDGLYTLWSRGGHAAHASANRARQ